MLVTQPSIVMSWLEFCPEFRAYFATRAVILPLGKTGVQRAQSHVVSPVSHEAKVLFASFVVVASKNTQKTNKPRHKQIFSVFLFLQLSSWFCLVFVCVCACVFASGQTIVSFIHQPLFPLLSFFFCCEPRAMCRIAVAVVACVALALAGPARAIPTWNIVAKDLLTTDLGLFCLR